MLWIFGKRYGGKVDSVPGLFFVKSYFLHVYWLPFMPQASYLMWDDPQNRFRGVRIPICWRSVFKAWLLIYPLFLFLLGSAIVTFVNINPPSPQNVPMRRLVGIPILVIVLGLPVWLWFRLGKLTTARALELGRLLSIPEFIVEQHMNGDRDALPHWLESQPTESAIVQTELPAETPTKPDTAIREARSQSVFHK